jgi:hypothetical protein
VSDSNENLNVCLTVVKAPGWTTDTTRAVTGLQRSRYSDLAEAASLSGRCVKLTSHLYLPLVPKLRMHAPVPPLHGLVLN